MYFMYGNGIATAPPGPVATCLTYLTPAMKPSKGVHQMQCDSNKASQYRSLSQDHITDG